MDASQDIFNTSTSSISGTTTIEFSRLRNTGDAADLALDECRFFLYAWGGTVDGESIGYHSQRVASSERVCLPNSTVCPGEPILSVSMKITHLHVVYVLIRWSYVYMYVE